MSNTVVIIAGAATVLALRESGEDRDAPQPAAPKLARPLAGMSVSLQGTTPGGKAAGANAGTVRLGGLLGSRSVYTGVDRTTKGGGPIDLAVQRGAAEIEKKVGEAIAKLSPEAKKAGAEALNKQLKLNPPLKGDEKWATIVEVAAGASAAAGCGAIPGVGAAVAPICAIAGAYLGKKGYQLAQEAWAKVEDDLERIWGKAQGEVADAAKTAWRWIT